jgi:hypothetical protein
MKVAAQPDDPIAGEPFGPGLCRQDAAWTGPAKSAIFNAAGT